MKKFLKSFKDIKVGDYKVPLRYLTDVTMSQFKAAIDAIDSTTWFDCHDGCLFINVSTSAINEPHRILKFSGYYNSTYLPTCHLLVDEIFNHKGKKYGATYSTIPITVGTSCDEKHGFIVNLVSEEGCKAIGCELKLKEPVFAFSHPKDKAPWWNFGVYVVPETFPIFNLEAGDYGCYIYNGSRGYMYIPAGTWEAYINNFGLVDLLRGV